MFFVIFPLSHINLLLFFVIFNAETIFYSIFPLTSIDDAFGFLVFELSVAVEKAFLKFARKASPFVPLENVTVTFKKVIFPGSELDVAIIEDHFADSIVLFPFKFARIVAIVVFEGLRELSLLFFELLNFAKRFFFEIPPVRLELLNFYIELTFRLLLLFFVYLLLLLLFLINVRIQRRLLLFLPFLVVLNQRL